MKCILVYGMAIGLWGPVLGSGSDLNENGSNRLICLNTWSSVGGAVWEGLRVMALLETVWQW